jgi:lipopolysaccharide transport system permease protein
MRSEHPGEVKAGLSALASCWTDLWQYRRFILGSVVREFQSRHARSLLGSAWLLLSPFAMILVYTIVFSRIMHSRLPGSSDPFAYSIYLCAGLLPWQWFTELLSRNIGIFVDHGGLIKKSTFPRMALPAIAFLSSTCNFLLVSSIFLMFLLVMGSWPGWAIFWVVPLLVLQSIFAASLGLALGVLNVFFRDIGQAMGILLQFWFWLTPIVYPANTLPEWAHGYLRVWNPVAVLFESYQHIFLEQRAPLWFDLWPLILVTLITVVLAIVFYRAGRSQLIDEL